jgi:Cytochrome c554 and c-prime
MSTDHPNPPDAASTPAFQRRALRYTALMTIAGMLAIGGAVLALRGWGGEEQGPALSDKPKQPELFANWPKQKPDVVLVLSGQMYGYLQKCGCSTPQKGGLERRYNLIQMLRARGWEVVPLDLGDVARMTNIPDQALLKYRVAMESLKDMAYRGVGIGKEEVRFPLLSALAAYSLNNDDPPVVATNVENRVQGFPAQQGSMLHAWEMTPTKGGVAVGSVAAIGSSLRSEITTFDNTIKFFHGGDGKKSVEQALDDIGKAAKKAKADAVLNVLLYQGKPESAVKEAMQAVEEIKAFRVVLCPTEESESSEPRAKPIMVNDDKTMIVQVGHRGQNVGVVGVFKNNKGELELHYERVPIGEEFETPPGREKEQPILKRLEWYANEVKAQNFLAKFPKLAHPLQGKLEPIIKKLDPTGQKGLAVAYVGSAACKECHPAEYAVWEKSGHSHAYEALEKKASKPSQRNFDPECIICHTIGLEYKIGYFGTGKDEPHLRNVGCENCHGPGSLHVAFPKMKEFLAEQSPWKAGLGDARLPDPAKLLKAAAAPTPEERNKILTPAEDRLLLRVHDVCYKCHDIDNDPHFKLEQFWPKIYHSAAKNP